MHTLKHAYDISAVRASRPLAYHQVLLLLRRRLFIERSAGANSQPHRLTALRICNRFDPACVLLYSRTRQMFRVDRPACHFSAFDYPAKLLIYIRSTLFFLTY